MRALKTQKGKLSTITDTFQIWSFADHSHLVVLYSPLNPRHKISPTPQPPHLYDHPRSRSIESFHIIQHNYLSSSHPLRQIIMIQSTRTAAWERNTDIDFNAQEAFAPQSLSDIRSHSAPNRSGRFHEHSRAPSFFDRKKKRTRTEKVQI